MITILGLFLFFGLTGLVLWHFNEAVWRDEYEDDSRDSQPSADGVEKPHACHGLCSPSDEPA